MLKPKDGILFEKAALPERETGRQDKRRTSPYDRRNRRDAPRVCSASKLPGHGYGAPGLATFRGTYNSSLSEIPDIFARSEQHEGKMGRAPADNKD